MSVRARGRAFNVSKKSGGHPHTNMAKVGERERESRRAFPSVASEDVHPPAGNARAAHGAALNMLTLTAARDCRARACS